MINKQKIEEASKNYLVEYINTPNIKQAFKAGVEWSESRLEEIAVEFAEWIRKEVYLVEWPDSHFELAKGKAGEIEYPEELFQQFLKERNENKK